ncbi:hypothetical protein [Roseateles sp.]|uniref:hypothetical protein n=1 Tax=Roseateles sp. TaxID=1971397 RepID=UPI0039EC72EB
MFQYRQVLVRLRAGDTAREIARSGLLGRDKITESALQISIPPTQRSVKASR